MPAESYSLSIIGGALCVAIETPDYDSPRYIQNHYPVRDVRPHNVSRFYDLPDGELSSIVVRQSFPGCYSISLPGRSWQRSTDLHLTNGGGTMPVATTFRDVPRPKTRLEIEWNGGYWHKRTAHGWKRIEW